MNEESVTLHNNQGSSDKVYLVTLNRSGDDWTCDYRYGRRVPGEGYQIQGTGHGTKTQTPTSYANALQQFQMLVAKQQTEKGYVIVASTSGSDGNGISSVAAVPTKDVSGELPQLLTEIKTEEQALQLCNNPSYCAQEKFDGERRLLKKSSGMSSARGINRKGEYVELPQEVKNSADGIMLNSFILDGESIGDQLYVWDLLKQNDEIMHDVPMRSRYERLRLQIPPSGSIKVIATAFTSAAKLFLFNQVKAAGGEGIVFKLVAAPYDIGKSKYAIKFKFKKQATVQVLSVHKTKRSVQMAVVTDDGIQPVGNVTIPPNHKVPGVGTFCEVEYLYAFPNGGSIFQACYKGPRPDKDEADRHDSLKFKVAHVDDDSEEETA